jgi:hypothetical protein
MYDIFGMKMMGHGGGQFQLEAKMNKLCQLGTIVVAFDSMFMKKSSVVFSLVGGSLRNGGRAS